jgi:toxin-antitoxin system PIN domain toxin
MLLLDANILIYAFRRDLPRHAATKRWLKRNLSAQEPLALHDLSELAFLRITTNKRAMARPSSFDEAHAFLEALRASPAVSRLDTGPEHRTIFVRLCREHRLSGSDLTDAFLAAVAIEAGVTLVSADEGFARFRNLRWLDPTDDSATQPE